MDDEQNEVKFLVGEWVPTREFAARLRQQSEQRITINEEPLPPDDPLYTGGIKIGFTDVPPEITPAEDVDPEFVSPRVPGRGTWSAKTGRRADEFLSPEDDES